ncbi:hypothetical protein [Chelativorans sp. AA-79]|uniref:DUF6923 family protein n=1 Tax=Chelativorans sp. AA-79 TaxID=3028735 RepID=UPI0023F7A87D|nr:hypothetical protein [Chelativorans sp. AA-79]WEX10575.1 hypothetical protein PVE73_06350 [Chelativorans sp. AA-79]
MGGSGTASSLNSFSNVATFIEPDFTNYGLVANSCIEGSNGYVSSFVLSKPLIAPIFHLYNLDASRLAITGTSTTGAAIGLQAIVRNNLMDVSGTTLNNTVQPATTNGCNNNTTADTINGACGSFRVTASSGLIQSLTLNHNATPPVSNPVGFNDGNAWTLSFPTAPLTKQFSPATIMAGETSQLTFSIANPNQSASVTLTPLDFTDNLPAGVTLASATATNNGSCGTPSVTDASGGALAVGATSVRATNISVAPGATCTVTVDVTATAAGSYTNDTSNMSSSVGNLVPTGSTTLTVNAQPTFGSCDGTMYLSQGDPTGLYSFDTSSNPFPVNPVGPISDVLYNGTAYNPADNYIYAIRYTPPSPTNVLLRIGSDGIVAEMGPIAGLPDGGGYGIGEIAPDGSYYTKAAGNNGVLYRVDIATRTATPITMSQSISVHDLAWHDGLLYASEAGGSLYSINPTSGFVSEIGPTGVAGAFGALYGATNGVYGGNNNGGFYQFDLTTGAATLISDLPGSSNNDGAKCVNSPVELPADLAITKDNGVTTYTPGLDASYTITVTNNGPFGVQNAQISDPLPAGVTIANWTCGNATGGAVCGAANGTGAIDTTANLPAGSSVTYTLSMGVPSGQTGSFTNTATVTTPDGVTDTNTANNTDSDTDTMAPPPVSGACSPRLLTPALSYTLAPFSVSGTVQRSGAPNGWNPDNPWSTFGGNYVFRWTFNQPVPANWIQFAVYDVGGGTAYPTTPPSISVSLAGGTATPADFSIVPDSQPIMNDMTYNASTGALGYVTSSDGRKAIATLRGNSADTVTSITITANNIEIGDHIAHRLFVAPACLTVAKVSQDGTGSFQIDQTNVVQANGTAVPSTTLTTTEAGTAVSSPAYNSVPGTDLTLSEVVPAGWNLASAVCTDQNAGSTGNPTVIGSFTSPTLTIPAANVRPQSDIQCLFTNEQSQVDLAITKDDGSATYRPGFDATYAIVVTNNGPDGVAGAQVSDPLPAGITDATWTCGGETGGAVCAVPSGTGAIDTTADLPAGASVTYTLSMSVPASFSGSLTNTATVSVPDGMTEADTSNNTASDTDTMEIPPSSGACSPRLVTAGNTFTLSPFPITGTVQKTAGAWQTDQPWATQGGDDYTIRWTFSQPIPANWIQFAVIDVNETGTADYDAVPPVFTVGLGAGSTATTADFSLARGDLTYSGGAVRFSPGGPYRQSGFVHGTSADTITSISITSSNVSSGDNIANSLFVRPPCLTVSKVSEGGTGSFQIDMTNIVQANGTAVPATTLTTAEAGTAVSSPMYFGRDTRTDITLSEVVPADWALQTAVCTDQNSANTGNPTTIGSFAAPAMTIPAANVRPEADIQCVFTNEQRTADLAITKDDGATTYAPGTDVVYTIVATNNGPDDVTDAAIDDPLPAGITTANWTCGGETNGAVCDAANGTGAIATTADLPSGASVTYTLTMSVPTDFTGDLVNTATVTAPAGVIDATPENNAATDTDTPADPVVSVRKELIGESITTNDLAEPGEVLTYQVTITHEGGSAFGDFEFIENIPNGATMTRVDGASGFTDPVTGSSTILLTVAEVPVGGEAVVEIDLTVAAPIPLGTTDITNRISGGDVPEDCTQCSVTTPTPPYTPNPPDTMSCSTSGAYFNTAYDGAGGMKTSGFDNYWQVALTPTPVTGAPPAGLTWGAATVVSNPPAVYITSPFGNANWISNSSTAMHPNPTVNYDIFYRYQFNLDPAVDPASLDLDMSFYADNSVYQVWVNGVAQNIQSGFGGADPYFYGGFGAGGVAIGSMNGAWQTGFNEIIVHVKSGPGAQAFMAQINSEAICQPKVTLRKVVTNDDGGTNAATDFTLRATNNATPADVIEGPTGDAAVTNVSIPAGTYTLAEDSLPGYAPSLYSCAVDGGATAPVADNQLTLANGQNAICTITNDDFVPVKALTDESGSIPDVAEPGETLTYTVTLTNDGDSDAFYDLTDNIDDLTTYVGGSTAGTAGAAEPTGTDPLTWAGITIPANSSVTVEYQVTVADTIPAGVTEIGNVAYRTGDPQPDCDVTPTPPNCVKVPASGAATPSKNLTGESGSIPDVAEPGETLTYTVTLTNSTAQPAVHDLVDHIDGNTGYVAASATVGGVAQEPSGSGPLTWADIVVPANGTVEVIYQVTVANPIPDGVTEIRNAATDDCTANPDACVTTPTPGTAVPSKQLTGESGSVTDVAEPGETLTYTVTLTNGGTVGALHDLVDNIDDNTTYVATSATVDGVAREPSGTDPLTWADIVVPANGTAEVIYQVTVVTPIPAGVTTIRNAATDDCTANPDACVEVPALQETDLSITKDNGRDMHFPGESTYTIVVTNNGPNGVAAAEISDPLPVGITQATWTCGNVTGGAICGAGSGTGAIDTTADLPAGSSVTYSLTMTVPSGIIGDITNTATVTLPNGAADIDESNNTATDTDEPQPDFGTCDATMYLGQNQPTQLFRFDTSSNPFVVAPVGTPSSHNYNAVAMNPVDNYIYALVSTAGTAGTLGRIGSDGSLAVLGPVDGLGVNAIAGEIGPDGTYYVVAGGRLYSIDIPTMSADSVPLSQAVNGHDLAWHNGLLYIAAPNNGPLYMINPSNGQVSTSTGTTGVSGTFGGLFGAPNGVFGSNNDGGFYRFDLATGQATLISNLQGSSNNDGAKCVNTPLDFPVDLEIAKDNGRDIYAPGETTYTITVSNNGPFGVQNALVNDALPVGITDAEWTCGTPVNGGSCGVPSGTGAITDARVNLPVGASVTFELTMTVPMSFTGDLVNTATVTSPSDSPDTDTSNNTATDTDTAQPDFGMCTSTMYLAQGDPTTLYSVSTSSNPFSYPAVGTASVPYNAAGYNPVDNYIYALRLDQSADNYRLLRVGSDGLAIDLGVVSGGGINVGGGLISGAGIAAGDIAADGSYYVKHNSSTSQMWRIDLSTRTATLITLSQPVATADMAWSNGLLYAHDPNTGMVYSISPSGAVNPIGQSGVTAGGFGAMIGASNGVFGALNSGGFYKFDLATGQATLISSSPATTSNNDGAKCATTPLDFPVDIAVTKDDGSQTYAPGGDIVYTMVVTNNGPFGVQNALVNDALPSFVTTATWTCGSPTGAASCGVASGSGSIVDVPVNLPVGDSVTFTLTMSVPSDKTGEIINTVTVTTPSGSPDTNPDDNTARDRDVYPLVETVKNLTAESGEIPNVAEAGETLTYTVTLNNTEPFDIEYDLTDNIDDSTEYVANSARVDGVAIEPAGPDPLVWSDIAIPANTSVSVVYQVLVDTPIPDGVTEIRNAATEDCAAAPQACTVTPTPGKVTPDKQLTGEDGGSIADVAEPGEVLTYTVVLSNAGAGATFYDLNDDIDALTSYVPNSATIDGVAVEPTGTDPLSWPDIEVAGNGNVTVIYRLRVADTIPEDTETIGNIAYEDGTDPNCDTNPDASCTNTNVPGKVTPDKQLTGEDGGSVPDVAEPGEVLTYTVVLTNAGAGAALYDLNDDIDALTSYVPNSATIDGVAVEPTGTDPLSWADVPVPGNGTATVIYRLRVADTIPEDTETIGNIAYEDGTDPNCDTNPDASCTNTNVPGKVTPDKQLTGEDGGSVPDVAEPGEVLTYTVVLTNAGAGATRYDLNDDIDALTSYVPNSATIDGVAVEPTGTDPLSWPDIEVAGGGNVTVIYRVRVADTIPEDTETIGNIAYEDGTDPNCDTNPDASCTNTNVPGKVTPDKQLTGEDGGSIADVAEPGEVLTYTVVLSNAGAGATFYDLNDDIDALTSYVPNSATIDGVAVEPTGTDPLSWPDIEVAGNGNVTVIYRVRVADTIPEDTETIGNIAYEDGTDPNCDTNPDASCTNTNVPGKVTPAKLLTGEDGGGYLASPSRARCSPTR